MKRLFPLTIVLALASCSMFTLDKGDVITRPFTAVDVDRTIVLSSSRTFEIVLPSHPQNGCHWQLSIDHPQVVTVTGHRFVPDTSGRECVGGETTWHFKTLGYGDAELTYSYVQPDGVNLPPSRIVKFTILVR